MKVTFQTRDRIMVAHMFGEIDHHSAEYFKQKLDDEIIARMPKSLVLDFSEVNFMDSSGIGVLMGRYKNLQKIGGTMCITNMAEHINRIFDMSGLSRIITKYESIDKAIQR